MANAESLFGDATETANAPRTSNHPKGKFTFLNTRKDCRCFQWTEAGSQGVTVLRRFVYLQHAATAWQDTDLGFTDSVNRSSLLHSGAARCAHLLQVVGSCEGGCLAGAAAAFLAAAWTELRHMALRELQNYAAVASSFDQPSPSLGDTLRVLLHMWTRSAVWTALHKAPADLLGDLNEASLESMASEELRALRGAVAVLAESWRVGLAQAGQHLASALRRLDRRASEAERGVWLLGWRLYLLVHRSVEASAPARSATSWELQPHSGSAQPSGRGLPAVLRLHACGGATSTAGAGGAPAVQPLDLLSAFITRQAAHSASAVLSVATDWPVGPSVDAMRDASCAGEGTTRANEWLQDSQLKLTAQLHSALDELVTAEAVSQRIQLLHGAASPSLDRAEEPGQGVPAGATPPHRGGPVRQSFPGCGGQRPVAPVVAAPASSSGSDGDGSVALFLDLLEALAPVLPPRRIARLCSNPAQLALRCQLAAAAKPAPGRPPSSSYDAALSYTLGAALVYGICLCMHQTHSSLSTVYCMSQASTPAEQALADRGLPDGLVDVQNVPVVAITRLPGGTTCQHAHSRVTAAGAAALAADGAKAVVADVARLTLARAAARAEEVAAGAEHPGSGGAGAGGQGRGARPQEEGSCLADATAWPPLNATPDGAGAAAAPGRAATRAALFEDRISQLLAPAAGAGELAPGGPRAGTAPLSAGDKGPEQELSLPLDRLPLLQAGLSLAAGRVCLLASASTPPGRPHRPVYRWGGSDRGTELPAQLTPAPAFLWEDGDGGGAQQEGPWSALVAASTSRHAILHAAVSSCAAATNRLAHVLKAHTPGAGADLKALCVAYGDAVTLGSAAERLLAVAVALGLYTWGQALPAEAADPIKLYGLLPKGGKPPAAGLRDAEGSDVECNSSTSSASSQPTAGGTGRGPRLPRKINWRRSLRRVMPSLASERARVFAASDSGAGGSTHLAGRGELPAGPGPPLKRGCWAGDPAEPAPLPPATALCRVSRGEATDVLDGDRPKRQEQQGLAAAAAAPAAAPPGLPLQSVSASVGAAQRSLASGLLTPTVLSSADSGLLRLLQALCLQLRDTARRAAELLDGEMRARIAAIYRAEHGRAAPKEPKGGAGGGLLGGPSATEQVVELLLRPLREAVVGLHPSSQAQLLSSSFAVVLLMLRQRSRGAADASGGAAGGAGLLAARRAGGGLREDELAKQLDRDLTLVEIELSAAWDQVDCAAGELSRVAASGLGRKGSTGGVLRDLAAMRADIEDEVRLLKDEVRLATASFKHDHASRA